MGAVWNNICKVGRVVDNLDISFSNSFVKLVCKGDNTLFWRDKWLGNQVLAEKFGRLFRLELEQDVLISNRFRKIGDELVFSWNWLRDPSGRTLTELQELLALLDSFSFSNGSMDKWEWILQSNGQFSTHTLSKMIDSKQLQHLASQHETDRIPVRVELDNRGVDLDSVRCPVCNNDLETVDHTFLHCNFAKYLWAQVLRWWKASRPSYSNLEELFCGVHDPSQINQHSSIWKAIEWVCGYVIWRNRNNTLFRQKKNNGPMALCEVQIRAFEWISRRSKKAKLDWGQWLLNPSVFDDHG
ncbi:uncharacterized protein [Rutidosis leptorrhynchoides]|uniref:uncharacterized protein n=1 Tax=Rutidosis leptorrhynchoides TaxID=125765 RepID=UPI003A99BB1A